MSYGIMCTADLLNKTELHLWAKRAEDSGIDTIWVPELRGRDPFVTAGMILGCTSNVRVGTAIANMYTRDALATKSAAYSLADCYGDRFDLGIGLSNKPFNETRGHKWLAPVEKAADFIKLYNDSDLMFPLSGNVKVYMAAHGPKLMAFAAEHLDGAFTYLQPVSFASEARKQLESKRLHVMQPTAFIEEPTEARRIARKALSMYMPLTNYHRAWRERGFSDDDFAGEGTDDFVDAIVARGEISSIKARYSEHLNAGANHIIIIPLRLDLRAEASWLQLKALTS